MYYYLPSLSNLLFSMFIAVRYHERTDLRRLRHRRLSDSSSVFELPDRDVWVGRRSDQLVRANWDEIVSVPEPSWLDHLLVSVPLFSPFIFKIARDILRRGGMVISDSGGAQILTGSRDYIDPMEVITVNLALEPTAAMVLDVPTRGVGTTKNHIKASALAQRKLMERYFRPTSDRIRWLVIMHAREPGSLGTFLKEVWDPRFAGAAVASSYGKVARSTCIVHRESGTDFIHVLGIGSAKLIPLLAWIGRYVPTLTSDSTSWGAHALARLAAFLSPHGLIYYAPVGLAYANRNQLVTRMPCVCPLCRLVSWMSVYAWPGWVSSTLLMWHNAFVFMDSAKVQAEVAVRCLDADEYISHLRSSGLTNEEVLDWIRYVSLFYEVSVKEAERYYKRVIEPRYGRDRKKFVDRPRSVWDDGASVAAKIKSVKNVPNDLEVALSCYLTPREMAQCGLEWRHPVEARAKGFVFGRQRREIYRRYRDYLRLRELLEGSDV